MRWFKHYTDNHRGQSVQILMDKFGHAGVSIYYMLMELCAEKINKSKDKPLTAADCHAVFHERILITLTRTKPATLRRIIGGCSALGLLQTTSEGSLIKISMPILLDLLERDFKRARSRRGRDAEICPSDIDKEIEIESISLKSSLSEPEFRASENFDAIYQRYPRKVGKSSGLKKFISQIKTKKDFDKISIALENFLNHHKRIGTAAQFIPHFSTFMNNWQDCLDPDYGLAQSFAKQKQFEPIRTVPE